MPESSETLQPTVPTPAEAPTPAVQTPEPMPVDRQPVSSKPADLVTPAVEPKRNIISKILSTVTFGKLGK